MSARFLLVVMVLFFLVGCAATQESAMPPGSQQHAAAKPAITKHYEQSLAKWTDNGLFTIEMVLPEKNLRMGFNSLEIIVHDKGNKDVPGAEITVTPWMPAMGHGVMEKPQVMERGGGLYSVTNLVLSMTGHWQLQVKVAKDGMTDNAVFEFPEVGPMEHGHMTMHGTVPADLDVSTTQMSENKLFAVSYRSLRGTIPINRILSWELNLKTADGKPVDNAKITIAGDMPEHHHGLPTQPEIMKGIGPGNYLIEGIKFSMPGWWVVTFHIQAGDMMDNVTFNLQLR